MEIRKKIKIEISINENDKKLCGECWFKGGGNDCSLFREQLGDLKVKEKWETLRDKKCREEFKQGRDKMKKQKLEIILTESQWDNLADAVEIAQGECGQIANVRLYYKGKKLQVDVVGEIDPEPDVYGEIDEEPDVYNKTVIL